MLDPISDMLTRIRNAQRAGHKEVVVPFSKLKMAIADILKRNGLVDFVNQEKVEKFNFIRITLKYEKISSNKKVPVITSIRRISKEGQRIYVARNEIKKIKGGYGIAILSTSKGVMSGKEAYQKGIGGEYICEVW